MGKIVEVALGFRAHSGWAAMVALAGPPASPAVIVRRRIELADPRTPRPVQPYHAAEKLDLAEAEQIVSHAREEARRMAREALRAVSEELRKAGHEVVACGVLLGSGRPTGSLAVTLASHALIHTAEGELFRGALVHAGERLRLPVTGIKEREALARGAVELHLAPGELARRLTDLGSGFGPPWTQDQKLSTLAAWLALAAIFLRRGEKARK